MTWVAGTEHVVCKAEVLDISGGGAHVLAERAPPAGTLVQVQLERTAAVTTIVEAHAIAAALDPSGRHSVRLKFTHWVPLESIREQHQERRLWQRFPVRETRARLARLEAGVMQVDRGELLNIGGGGAAVIVDVTLPADDAIWFELENDDRTLAPVESRLVVTSLDPSGTKIARIRFVEPCPLLVFELAIHGSH
jgi:hypothetical protein